jgi:hypothetical protein
VNTLNAVPVIGQPLAYGIGFLVLILVAFARPWSEALVTVAHESGHMITAIITGRGFKNFRLTEDGGGATPLINYSPGIADTIVRFSGYPTPPLMGLAGAALISKGQVWSVLWLAVVLLFVVFFQAARLNEEGGPITQAIVLLAFLAVAWIAIDGPLALQAAVAVGLTWLLLIGGAYDSLTPFRGLRTGDGQVLGERTFIPAVGWELIWSAIGLYALIAGVKYLL